MEVTLGRNGALYELRMQCPSFINSLCCLVFCQWHQLKSSGNRKLQLRKCLHQISRRQVWFFFFFLWLLINEAAHCEGCHPWVGVLSYVRKQAEQALDSKPVSSIPHGLYFISSVQILALTSLHDGLQVICWNIPFPSQVPFGYGLYHGSNREIEITNTITSVKYKNN